MSQAALSRIPLPLKLAFVVVLGLIAFKLIAQATGILTILVVVLWVLVGLAVGVDNGSLAGLNRVPGLGHCLRFVTNAKGRFQEADETASGRGLTEAEREALLADAMRRLNIMVGIDSAIQAVHANVIDMAAGRGDTTQTGGRGFNTQLPGVILLLVGPPGVGKATTAREIARLYAGLGVTETARVTTVSERDAMRVATEADLEAFAEDRAGAARGGVLLLEDADWLVAQPDMPAGKPGVAFGLGLVRYLVSAPRSLAVVLTISATTERQLRNDADHARWLSKLAVRTIPFDDLDESALLELVHRQLDGEGFAIDPDAERAVSGLLREELARFGRDYVDNANAALRTASRLSEAARRSGESGTGDIRVLTRADVRTAVDEG